MGRALPEFCGIGMFIGTAGSIWALAGAGLGADFFAADFVGAFFLLGAGFFLATDLAGVGMVMPGMSICWARAGAGIKASALAARSILGITIRSNGWTLL